MAPRIRSVHPGQWADDDFVELSLAARLLAIAIRNIADDRGVFEWKPKQIKRACFPADDFGTEALLNELSVPNQFGMGRIVQAFKSGGRYYGAVKNFGKWQRIKKPNFTYPLPASLVEYIHLSRIGAENKTHNIDAKAELVSAIEASRSESVPNKFGISVAEVGGRKEVSTLKPKEGFNAANAAEGLPPKKTKKTNPDPEPKDDRTWLFQNGLNWVSESTGRAANALRSTMGLWLKDAKDDPSALRSVIETAMQAQPADPVSWISAAMKSRAGQKTSPPAKANGNGAAQFRPEEDRRRLVLAAFCRTKIWPPNEGPPPGDPECRYPEVLLRECGVEQPTISAN